MNKSIKSVFLLSIFCYIFFFVISLLSGRYLINISDIFNLTFLNSQLEKQIIFNLRLPRTIAASIVGIAMSLAGLIYQEMLQNDLVSPDFLGVTSDAGVGASIAIVLFLHNIYIIFFSFFFGVLTVIMAVVIANIFRNKNNITLVLSGIIVSSFMSSLLTAIKYFVNPETQLSTIVYWLMGSFKDVTFIHIIIMCPIVFISLFVLILISHRINIIALGREESETKG